MARFPASKARNKALIGEGAARDPLEVHGNSVGPGAVSLEIPQEAAPGEMHRTCDGVQIDFASLDPLLRSQDGHVHGPYDLSVALSRMGRSDGHLLAWTRGGEVPDMAQPPKKRPFVPSEQDRRRASEFKRKAKEIGQPALAGIVGVKVRTLQRYMDLERAMPSPVVDRYDHHFRTPVTLPVETPSQPQLGNGDPPDDAALERVLAHHEIELSYAQVKRIRALQASGLALSEQQWEQLVSAILTGRQPSP